jgi:hypothetical protein
MQKTAKRGRGRERGREGERGGGERRGGEREITRRVEHLGLKFLLQSLCLQIEPTQIAVEQRYEEDFEGIRGGELLGEGV